MRRAKWRKRNPGAPDYPHARPVCGRRTALRGSAQARRCRRLPPGVRHSVPDQWDGAYPEIRVIHVDTSRVFSSALQGRNYRSVQNLRGGGVFSALHGSIRHAQCFKFRIYLQQHTVFNRTSPPLAVALHSIGARARERSLHGSLQRREFKRGKKMQTPNRFFSARHFAVVVLASAVAIPVWAQQTQPSVRHRSRLSRALRIPRACLLRLRSSPPRSSNIP